MAIIACLLVLCLFWAFWFSAFGKKSGLAGEDGAILDFCSRECLKIRHSLEWFFENPANAKTGAWSAFIILFILFWIFSVYHTLNPFSIYKTTISIRNAFQYDECMRNLEKSRRAGDSREIQKALKACEKNLDYQTRKNAPQARLLEYESCRKNLARAKAAGDLRNARKTAQSCAKNYYFRMAKAYPQFDAVKFEECDAQMRETLGIDRQSSQYASFIRDTCFKKHRGPLADADWLEPPAKTTLD